MTQREADAVIEMLDTCEESIEVEAKRAEGTSEKNTSRESTPETATATPTLVPERESQESNSVCGSCEEAVEARESKVQGSKGVWEGISQGNGTQRQSRGRGWSCMRSPTGPTLARCTSRSPMNKYAHSSFGVSKKPDAQTSGCVQASLGTAVTERARGSHCFRMNDIVRSSLARRLDPEPDNRQGRKARFGTGWTDG